MHALLVLNCLKIIILMGLKFAIAWMKHISTLNPYVYIPSACII